MFNYSATVVRVVDGDTIVLSFDLGFRIYHQACVRLIGIDCPERGTQGGTDATAFLNKLCPIGTRCAVITVKDATDKYGRYLAGIYLPGSGDLAAFLIANGHGISR